MSLICIDAFPGHPRFKGLGELSADELGSLFHTRHAITGAQYELAARAWDGFRADHPRALDALLRADTSALPFLAAALARHPEDYPWTRDGLSRTERRVMSLAQAAPIDVWTTFPLMHDDETAFYIADQSFWQVVTALESATPPLVALDVTSRVPGRVPAGTIALTDTGRSVLGGHVDRVEQCGIDRWLGGVHLRGTQPVWRWDHEQGRIWFSSTDEVMRARSSIRRNAGRHGVRARLRWQQALAEAGMLIDGWRVHRRIGMSGGLFTRAIAREIGRALEAEQANALQHRHGEIYKTLLPHPRPLPGAVSLLRRLRDLGIAHGIATSGRRPEINRSLEMLEIPQETVVIERGDVMRAKPEPDLFLACQERLGVHIRDCFVIGDAVWDLLAARRAGMLSVGVLSGGYGAEELIRAGAFRVYRDARELDVITGRTGSAAVGSQGPLWHPSTVPVRPPAI